MAGAGGVFGDAASPPSARLARLRLLLARPGYAVWAILAVALAARAGFVLATTDWVPIFDPGDYDRHAKSIVHGDGYPDSLYSSEGSPTALRMPLFPLFIAAVYSVTGESLEAARLAQALLGTVTVALIGAVAWRLFGRRVGLVAMAIAAVFPLFVVLTGTLMSENLLLPLELGALLAVLEHRRSQYAYRWLVVAGVLCGLAMLTRPNAIVLLAALALGVWTARPEGRWRATAVLLVLAAAVYAPWPIRNARTLHEFIPLSTELGVVAASMYNDYSATQLDTKPGAWAAPWQAKGSPAAALVARKDLTEAEMDSKLTAEAWRYIREHPTYPAEVGFWNTLRLLHVEQPNPYWHWRNIGVSNGQAEFARFGFYPVLLLALVGLFAGIRRAPAWVWLTPVVMWLSLVFLNNEPRARAPIDPYLILLAAVGAVMLWDRARGGSRAQPSPGA